MMHSVSSHLWVEVMLQDDQKGLIGKEGDLILKLISLGLTQTLRCILLKQLVQWLGT